jgi:Dullard-like phosphatase family protein
MFFSSKAVDSIAVHKDVPVTAVVPGQRPVKPILYRDSCYAGPSSKRRQNRNKRISMRPDLRQIKWIEPRKKTSSKFKQMFSNLYHTFVDSIFSPSVVSLSDTQTLKKALLVLDMDETLLHTAREGEVLPRSPDTDCFAPKLGTSLPVFKRPGVDQFLKEVAAEYEVAVWTAGVKEYAEPVLNWLDPNGYRDSCTEQDDGSYVKDLSRLNRSLSEVIIVDNNSCSFAFHPENGIQCLDFYFDKYDMELKRINHFLHVIKDAKDVRTVVPQFQEWVATGHLSIDVEDVDCCDDFSAFADIDADTVEDDAQEMLGSFFYIDDKGRQRRRSHRLSKK